MRLAAVSLFGLVVGLAWSASILGECDRADCGWLGEFLFSTAAVGFALVVASLCALLASAIRALRRGGRRSRQPRASGERPRQPAWAVALATTSVCLLAFVVLAIVGGIDGWWSLAVAAAAGLTAGAVSRSRVRQ